MAKTILTGDTPSRFLAEESALLVPLRDKRPLDFGAATYGATQPELDFPGCEPMRLTPDEIDTFEGRLEFWDARAETAWVVREPTSPVHESPAHGLVALVERIAAARGSPIKCYGAMALMQRDADGAPRRIMQADQSVYLRPKWVVLPGPRAMIVGEHALPDVVLEVDHTTDIRRGKLLQYEAWEFPEVWVEVPDWSSPSRPRGLVPGLTIHLLEGGAYETSVESRAFPGWTAAEIHAAMNETTPSARTYGVLERVGTLLGAREGTGPNDDPLLRSQRRQGFEAGRAEGRAEGPYGNSARSAAVAGHRGFEAGLGRASGVLGVVGCRCRLGGPRFGVRGRLCAARPAAIPPGARISIQADRPTESGRASRGRQHRANLNPGSDNARAILKRAARLAGFTLLETTVALAIFAAGGMALYGLFNNNLIGLGKAADISRREPAVLRAVEHLSSINIREQPTGQLEIGGFDIGWSSNLVEPVRQSQSLLGFLGSFEVGLYDVDIELSRNGRPDSTHRVRLAGYQKVRQSETFIE